MVAFGRVSLFRYLYRVEAKLSLQVRGLVLRVPNGVAKLRPQLGILNRNRVVHSRMAANIRGIVRQGAESKGVLVLVLALFEHRQHEVAASDVVNQVAELHASKRIVAEVLDDGATVGKGVSLLDLFFRQPGIFLEQQRTNFIQPKQVDNFFVSKKGVGNKVVAAWEEEEEEQQCEATKRQRSERGSGEECHDLFRFRLSYGPLRSGRCVRNPAMLRPPERLGSQSVLSRYRVS